MRRSALSAREVDHKNFGGGSSPPTLFCLVKLLLLFLLCLFLGCHGSILPSIVDGNSNDPLLHSSFVEPLKSEVKKKISSLWPGWRVERRELWSNRIKVQASSRSSARFR